MIFQALLDRFKHKPGFIASLDKSEIDELRLLSTNLGWHTYINLLDAAIEYHAQSMLADSCNDADVHRLRGLIRGLEFGPMLVDNIINKEDPKDERERHKQRLADQRARDNTSLYGTSHWRGQEAI